MEIISARQRRIGGSRPLDQPSGSVLSAPMRAMPDLAFGDAELEPPP
jgi:hypothetical protein